MKTRSQALAEFAPVLQRLTKEKTGQYVSFTWFGFGTCPLLDQFVHFEVELNCYPKNKNVAQKLTKNAND